MTRYTEQQISLAQQIVMAFWRKNYNRDEVCKILGITRVNFGFIKNKTKRYNPRCVSYCASNKSVFDVLRWWQKTDGIIS